MKPKYMKTAIPGTPIEGKMYALETAIATTCFILDTYIFSQSLNLSPDYLQQMTNVQEGANSCGVLAQGLDMGAWLRNQPPKPPKDVVEMALVVSRSACCWGRFGCYCAKLIVAKSHDTKPFLSLW
jgi:hypothetical protein